FDGAKTYNGEMRGEPLGKTVFLIHRDLSADFVKDFMQRNGMEVFYRGERIANLSLQNTYAAVAEVANCQRDFGLGKPTSGRTVGQNDPFASAPSSSGRDPFR